MAWFIGQSLLMILTAFLLGLLTGWLLFSRRRGAATTPAAEAAPAVEAPAAEAPAVVAVPVAVADEPKAEAKPKKAAKAKSVPAPAAPADDQIEVQQRPVSLVAPIAKPGEADEPKAEEPKAEEPKADEPKADEPKADGIEPALLAAVEAAQQAGFDREADGLTPEEVVLVAAGDNLQRIEGIGPRMEAALTAAGLGTYAALAEADNDTLRRAIEAQGLSFAPALLTWARQARLLADGDEEALADLQRRLVAGRDTGRE